MLWQPYCLETLAVSQFSCHGDEVVAMAGSRSGGTSGGEGSREDPGHFPRLDSLLPRLRGWPQPDAHFQVRLSDQLQATSAVRRGLEEL